MKKLVLILMIAVLLTACGTDTADENKTAKKNESSTETTPESTPEPTIDDTKDKYEGMQAEEVVIRKRVEEQYTFTDVSDIKLNANLGTEDVEDDLIALVYLTWNQKNSGKTSKEVLAMYSSDLAATVASECPKIQEIAIFWEVPYLNDNAKCSFERKNGNMYVSDQVWGKAFE